MLSFITSKILGSQNERAVRRMRPLVAAINALEPVLQALPDEALRAKTPEFKGRLAEEMKKNGYADDAEPAEKKEIVREVLERLLPEAFAVVREVSRRTLGLRHFDVQMIGGIVLHRGGISEMATGEGKTLAATLPVYLNALMGRGVHVVTVNDYLAKRDREWMGPIYEFLGLTVGVIQHDQPFEEKYAAYRADITYGTNNEFGFDYLRDNMVVDVSHRVQPELFYAIVDEVDSILIDEARTPLIISGPTEESVEKYYLIDRIIPHLKRKKILEKDEIDAKFKGVDIGEGFDAVVDEKRHTVNLTEEGIAKCEKLLNVASLYDDLSGEWAHHIISAIKAYDLFERDVDYVVKDGKVIIVDEFTGRLMPGRRWSDGMHQAIEAKERLRLERENQTLATITLQNYFRLYQKLAGMTGTAMTEANEFKQIYNLDVVVIPTNRPLVRANHPDMVFRSVKGKFAAVVGDIAEKHAKGQPVLVGTISIERSEALSEMLKRAGVPHNVLNAKYHELEAHIVAQAGRYKAVTIATNMAGRGTDILLGGNPEFMARNIVLAKKLVPGTPEYQEEFARVLVDLREQARVEHEKVVEAGGLHVIGTERHEARRIDNQLRGRSGRQGDPGSSRFYVSLEDDLMRLFGSERLGLLMDKFGMREEDVIEHPWVTGSIETAQRRVEGHNFEIRKHLLEYDDVMNKQREIIYAQRREFLEGGDLREYLFEGVDEVIGAAVEQYCPKTAEPEAWDRPGFEGWLVQKFGPVVLEGAGEWFGEVTDEIKVRFVERARALYAEKEKAMGAGELRQLERMIMLHVIDSRWKDHLYEIDQMKEGINLRAYGQRDPLVEYQREAYTMFADLMARIQEEVIQLLFRVQVVTEKAPRGVFDALPKREEHEEFHGLSRESARMMKAREASPDAEGPSGAPDAAEKPAPERRDVPKVGRNDPCPCGSGKKYKKCCGA